VYSITLLLFKIFLQYNIFTNKQFIQLFLTSLLAVFCLPVNIYLTGALMIVPLLLLVKPKYTNYFAYNHLPKVILLKIIFSLIAGVSIAAAYYVWLYSKQIPTDAAFALQSICKRKFITSSSYIFFILHM
jgi:hypothetical protein